MKEIENSEEAFERERKRKDMLSDCLYNLSKISFAGCLLFAIFAPTVSIDGIICVAVLLAATIAFAVAGYRVMK